MHLVGLRVFWEKDWGKINEETYREHTVPLIHGWIDLNKGDNIYLYLMQDGAPGHAAQKTIQDLEERGVHIIFWPAFSPDLNPIETCWNWVKDYIQDKWGLEEEPSYNRLREYVKEAWNALPEGYITELLASTRARCQAVIDAEGAHTKY